MSVLRRVSTARLVAVCVAVLVAGILVATAVAALAPSASPPPAKPLSVAVHDALAAPKTTGLSARIRFVNKLFDVPGEGVGPVLAGSARGRLWLASDGRARLELQSDAGDAQLVSDGRQLLFYDSASQTAYRFAFPQQTHARTSQADKAPPSLADVRDAIARLSEHASIGRANPGVTAGRPSYTVKIGPRDRGGLLGAAELAWDAARGVPLRAALYARGNADPVLELEATHISYGAVADSVFALRTPPGAHVVNLAVTRDKAGADTHRSRRSTPLAGLSAARRGVSFRVSAPKALAGRALHEVRTVDWSGEPATLLVYGNDLSALVVVERKADGAARLAGKHGLGMSLPSVSIGGTRAQELATPLGSFVTFERAGVSYTVLGSVPSATVVDAARSL